MGGLTAAFALLQALARREVTGTGMNFDLAQFESSVSTLGPLLLASAVNGQAPPRMGNRSTRAAPQGCYQCAGDDQWCAISVQTDEQWQALVKSTGIEELADTRFAGLPGRLRHHDEIDAAIEAWTSKLPKEEVESRLQVVGVPAERMRRINEVMELPEAKQLFRPLEDPPGYSMPVTTLPFAFSRSEIAPLFPAPGAGEHTASVLEEWLGMDAAEVERLESAGVLV
jgi:benzylsuccinate CoA-transferase BbsF subunit